MEARQKSFTNLQNKAFGLTFPDILSKIFPFSKSVHAMSGGGYVSISMHWRNLAWVGYDIGWMQTST